MNRDRIMRLSLQVTAPFNFAAAYALAYPASSLGVLFGLPTDAPAVYRVLASGMVALFGAAYGWLSVQPVIDRPMVALATCGKLLAFASLVALAVLGHIPVRTAVLGSGDLFFALIFVWWWFDA